MSQVSFLLRVRFAAFVVALVVCLFPLVAHADDCIDDCHDLAMDIYQDHGETEGAYDLANYVWGRCVDEC